MFSLIFFFPKLFRYRMLIILTKYFCDSRTSMEKLMFNYVQWVLITPFLNLLLPVLIILKIKRQWDIAFRFSGGKNIWNIRMIILRILFISRGARIPLPRARMRLAFKLNFPSKIKIFKIVLEAKMFVCLIANIWYQIFYLVITKNAIFWPRR